ncbi:YbjN domain-containing protein [Amphiplicatus metriothermophilus]|uniref:Putative sensory transduction regulator n=1 Tax=Amphiplicatus metriothermophilus TaxID=1519374 RepID=A0A239PJC3_9PROT|nr:YbjN domain-containing protein [Amphiplicatus metriothermophilus]MBB5517788.1 hypothetical protein [Amphiplicatus metriothermophilus]SNT67878.1 Putative sensory transduction regulator [Amphiplicatus metriothermophilus]
MNRIMNFFAAAGAAWLIGAGAAGAQTTSAVTAEELEAALAEAGLSPAMTRDAATGAPVARGSAGDIIFWVRALDCAGAPPACENLLFFANFDLGRAATAKDYEVINAFNERQVFGRAYIIEGRDQVGVDYVIDLAGGVTAEHLALSIGRWADVIAAFIDNFRAGHGVS